MDETVELACAAMRTGQRLQHVALNVAKLVNIRFDPVLAADVANSDMVSIDGMGIVWGARLLGLPVKERVTGVDLLARLLAACAGRASGPISLARLARCCSSRCNAHAQVPVASLCRSSGTATSARSRKLMSSAKSATVAPTACSSGCRPRARSGFSPPIATRWTCPSSWESAAPSTCSAVPCSARRLACSRSGSNGCSASTRSRAACGGATPKPTRCSPPS